MIFSILVFVCCFHYVAGMGGGGGGGGGGAGGGGWNVDRLYQFKDQNNILLDSQYSRYELAFKGRHWL